jgi:hypothetical protein
MTKLPAQQKKKGFLLVETPSNYCTNRRSWFQYRLEVARTVVLSNDTFNGAPLGLPYPELFSFAIDKNILISKVVATENIFEPFHLPLSTEAFHQINNVLTGFSM